MEHLISVIVCTYNQQATIGRTLDSILMQQCHVPFEIVVGEDCSTDETLRICQEYADRYPDIVRIMANARNKGLVDNYFDCILASRGEYIADCAGDDFWTDPLKLEREVSVLEQHPEVTLVHTNWQFYDEATGQTRPNGADISHIQPFTDGKRLLLSIITQTRHPIIQLCTSLYRKQVFLEAYQNDTPLFRSKDFGCEDLQIACVMADKGTIAFLPAITLNYSVGTSSISNTHDEQRQYRFVRQVTNVSYYLCKKYRLHNTATEQYFTYRLYALSMHAFRCHSHVLRDDVKRLRDTWQATPDWRYRLVHLVMSTDITWQAALTVRKLSVAVKQGVRQ